MATRDMLVALQHGTWRAWPGRARCRLEMSAEGSHPYPKSVLMFDTATARPLILGAVLAVMAAAPASAQDAAEGKKVFTRQCVSCHIDAAEGPRRLGPTLFGVVGRKTGAVEGFRYTEANKNAGWVWTPEKLDVYLKNPREVIPGTNMAFAGVRSDGDRANLIEYLKSLK